MPVADAYIRSKINYCNSLTTYSRRQSIEVKIGDTPLGAHHPIRVQSMTTIDTMDTKGSVEQSIRMIEAGCEYVRITAPSVKEAQNLEEIKKELRKRGYNTPLVADIHFTPNAAELAARIVEKVRINPGNYADKKKFETIEYTDASYEQELGRIREKFIPLLKICKEYGTAMRIGTNHGSLSDRIMSRYGDTPLGMVESALEFLRIAEEFNYYSIVLSMKSSNTQVMVQAYRLLVQKLDQEGFKPYPLHLGVTEAGEAEDGRIKSAVGIGTLLEDGLGDTVRVSLTEEPELEMPVGRDLVDRYKGRAGHASIRPIDSPPYHPFQYTKRKTFEVGNIGGDNVPRVITDISRLIDPQYPDLKVVGHFYLPEPDKWRMNDYGTDYVYSGMNPVAFMLPMGLREIIDYPVWKGQSDRKNTYPLLIASEINATDLHPEVNFIQLNDEGAFDIDWASVAGKGNFVAIVKTDNAHAYAALRRLFFMLEEGGIALPVIIRRDFDSISSDRLMLHASTDVGGLLIDGYGDGIMLGWDKQPGSGNEAVKPVIKLYNDTSFGILQAARTRMSKTEYISCPSCGRTLFDLQETTAMIRKRTDHLKGVKIGIMGCIVNGPGEMADADYGYVGSGKGRITLYKGKEVIKRSVPSAKAVDELIDIIRQDGKWLEPEKVEP